jgi:hypothetical protein
MILPDDELTELEAKDRAWRAYEQSGGASPEAFAAYSGYHDALRNAAPALIAAARRERRLEVVVKVVLDTWLTSHSMHWDKEGTHGANCPACVLDRDARAQLRAAVEEK